MSAPHDMAQPALRTHALFFGNLNNDLPKVQISALIRQLAHQCAGVVVDSVDINVRFSQPSDCFVASLSLPTKDEQTRALTHISQCLRVPNGLVKAGRALRVDVFQNKTRRKGGRTLQQDDIADDNDDNEVFTTGQHLGAESRFLEFKEMSCLNLQVMRQVVSRYVCAFLNSSGGVLMFGVNDQGNVQGTPISHKQEDEVRLMIDQVINHFDPPVLPQMYSVLFVSVEVEGRPRRYQDPNPLKVIKLSISQGRPNTLYATPSGEVFIRRDGSVQGPLKPRDIKEWCNMNFESKEKAYQEEIASLQTQVRQAEYDRQLSRSTSPKSLKKVNSSVCTIL